MSHGADQARVETLLGYATNHVRRARALCESWRDQGYADDLLLIEVELARVFRDVLRRGGRRPPGETIAGQLSILEELSAYRSGAVGSRSAPPRK